MIFNLIQNKVTWRHTVIISITFVGLFSSVANAEEVKSRLNRVSHEHPRLFMKREDDMVLRLRSYSDPALRKAFAHVTTLADDMLGVKPVVRTMEGKRMLETSRTTLKRVLYLALAHRLTGRQRYTQRAQEEMLAAAGFRDWNPSHFLDVAEMTAALAVGYDWLYEALEPKAREEIKQAIVEKGLRVSLEEDGWVESKSNWNQVCHGGLVLGALAVLEDEPDLAAQIVERAVVNLPKAMAAYAPDGGYPEGPLYWKYGTTYNVLLISALESALGTDFGLSKLQGFLESSDYYLQVAGPTGMFFNYSDSSLRGGVSPIMYWFAAKRENPSLLWRERQELAQFLTEKHSPENAANPFFPFLMIWARAVADISPPKVNHWKADGQTPVGFHRSGWKTPQETFVALKGGSPGTPHGHMDIGTFVIDAHGVRWAEDLGYPQSYQALESLGIQLWDSSQDGQRWDVFRLNNFSHNTLVVDGKKQLVNGHASIISFSDQAPMPHTIVELSEVYENQLAAAKRGIGLHQEHSVIVQDELETLDRKTTVRWGMVTRAQVKIEGERTAILRQGDEELSLRILSPANAKLELFETAKPPQEYDAPNKGTRMIGFKVQLPPSTKARFVVELDWGDAEITPLKVQPLADW